MSKQIWIWLGLAAVVAGLGWYFLIFERLGAPVYLLGLLTALPLAGLAWRLQKQGRTRLQALFDADILPRLGLQSARTAGAGRWGLSLLVLALFCVALARPQGGPVLSRTASQGLDILVAFDISSSMQAADTPPSRLEASRQALRHWLTQISGDRIGLMVFAGKAFPLAPFTHDTDALSMLLEEVQPDLLDSHSTNLEEALKLARQRFAQRRSGEQSGQILVIFSDGENQLGDYDTAAKALAADGVVIFTVGTGTPQGARIPERTIWGGMAYKTWQGQEVISQLDSRILKKIAGYSPQGAYLTIDDVGGLPQQIDRLRGTLATTASGETELRQFEERYQAWLLVALLLLALERSWPLWQPGLQRWLARRRQRLFPRLLQQLLRQRAAVLLLPLFLGAWNWPWQDLWHGWRGEQAYRQDDLDAAREEYHKGLEINPEDPVLQYNQGNSQYRAGDYDAAIEAYRRSAESPQATPEQQAQALYNLGNSHYRRGQKNPAQAREAWQQAIEAYQKALEKNRQDTQALENLNHVQEQLQQLPPPEGGNQPEDQPSQPPNQQDNNGGEQNPDQQPSPQPGDGGDQSSQLPEKAENSPLDGMFSDQEIQQYLEQLKQQEQQDRGRGFQRRPGQNGHDPFEMDDWLKDSQTKDW
ncbi:MAG: VWA domain-containing protein [Candidatus Sericytochromatia bacterium]|nr:VWA domain-containing protein [Candidatus Sericytochromatia bacterium]